MDGMSTTVTVNEIFFSIQGEGERSGWPCIFIRLAFCNLRCSWCDSEYTFYEGKEMSIDQVMDAISGYPCQLVEVTGGEPLMQEGANSLMKRLCDQGYEVMLETSGSLDIAPVDPRVRRIMDLKCPGSGMMSRNRMDNLTELRGTDELKFVIKDRLDYEWAKEIVLREKLHATCSVLFSPVWDSVEFAELAEWILDDGLPVRLQLQIHKFIWDPKARGV
jgi:7-carboxy-7-deazaguanine synthase